MPSCGSTGKLEAEQISDSSNSGTVANSEVDVGSVSLKQEDPIRSMGTLQADVLVGGKQFVLPWMEIGFVSVPTDNFVTVTSQLGNRSFLRPHVIMGPPRDGGQGLFSGYESCTRIKGINRTASGNVQFMVRVVQPNDTWCNYTWWHPRV